MGGTEMSDDLDELFDATGDANDFDPHFEASLRHRVEMRDEIIEALTAERDQLYERWNDCQEKRMAAVARAEAAEAELKAMTAERDRAIDDAKYNAQYVDLVVHYRNERDAMAAENNRLREALKPFANYAKSLKGWEPTEAVCSETGIDFERVVNAGDFFAARVTLKGEQK